MRRWHMKAWTRNVAGALFLLLGIALGARLIFAVLVPLLPLIIYGLFLAGVLAVALGFWRHL